MRKITLYFAIILLFSSCLIITSKHQHYIIGINTVRNNIEINPLVVFTI